MGCSGFRREVERRWRSLTPQHFDNSSSKGRAAPCCTRQEFHTALAHGTEKLRVMRLSHSAFCARLCKQALGIQKISWKWAEPVWEARGG